MKSRRRMIDDKLFMNYYEQGLNDCRIAEKLGHPSETICYHRHRLGLPTVAVVPLIDEKALVMLHSQGFNDREIAEKLHCHQSTITQHRQKLSIPARTPRESQRHFRIITLVKSGKFTNSEIAGKIGCDVSVVLRHKRLEGLTRKKVTRWNSVELQELCYGFRRQGLTDEQIRQKIFDEKHLNIEVPVFIGRALMRRCREKPSCPFKALLPEEDRLKSSITVKKT